MLSSVSPLAVNITKTSRVCLRSFLCLANSLTSNQSSQKSTPGPEVIIFFFMLNSVEHGICPAHKC